MEGNHPSLRVEKHSRGHIAACNGAVEQIHARVERTSMPVVCTDVVKEEMKQYAELQARRQRLAQFRVRVKERVRRKERERSTSVSRLLPEEDKKGLAQSRIGHRVLEVIDRDEVQVVLGSGRGAACQQLVVHCGQCSPDSREDRGGRSVQLCPATGTESTASCSRGERVKGDQAREERRRRSVRREVTPQGLQVIQRKKREAEFLAVHRLYSELERQQSRLWAQQQQQRRDASSRREEREMERRIWEDEEQQFQGKASPQELKEEEEESAKQWEELIGLEQRRRKLQHAQELERYCEALYQQLRRRHGGREPPPPLCPCHSSLWECSPETCASNCSFYLNHKAFARALHSLLQSLNM